MRIGIKITAILLIVSVFTEILQPSITHAQSKIKIGISTALSGAVASVGADVKNAIVLANDLVGNGKYELIIEDDKCSARDGVAVAKKFAEIDKVSYVLGLPCSSVLAAALPVYEKAGILVISSAASTPEVSCAGRFNFRTWPSDLAAARTLARYAGGHYASMAILSEEMEYPTQFSSMLKKEVPAGFRVVEETVLPGTTDFHSVLLKLSARKPGVIFLNPLGEQTLILMLKQLREMKLTIPVLAAFFPSSRTFLEAEGVSSERLEFVDLPSSESFGSATERELMNTFEARFGPPAFTELVVLTGYESFSALNKALTQSANPVEFLKSSEFHGVFGRYSFDKCGDVQGLSPVMKELKGGRVLLIEAKYPTAGGNDESQGNLAKNTNGI